MKKIGSVQKTEEDMRQMSERSTGRCRETNACLDDNSTAGTAEQNYSSVTRLLLGFEPASETTEPVVFAEDANERKMETCYRRRQLQN